MHAPQVERSACDRFRKPAPIVNLLAAEADFTERSVVEGQETLRRNCSRERIETLSDGTR